MSNGLRQDRSRAHYPVESGTQSRAKRLNGLPAICSRVFLASACVAFLAAGCGDAAELDVSGRISVARPCEDLGGFDDIPRLQIIIRDPDGKFLVAMTPQFTNSEIDRQVQAIRVDKSSCSFTYTADQVPKLDTYLIDAGRRGEYYVVAAEFGSDQLDAADLDMTEDAYEEAFGDLPIEIFSLTVG